MSVFVKAAHLQQGAEWLLGRLFPYRCVVCRLPADRAMDLCADCELSLPWLNHVCDWCQESLSETATLKLCGACILKPPPFEKLTALFSYDFPLVSLVHGLKFANQTAVSRVFGELLAQHLQQKIQEGIIQKPDAIIPVPLHRKRLLSRGYNQAELIALSLKSKLKLPLLNKQIVRTRYTEAQASLGLAERRNNIRNAFSVHKPIPYQHVAIIDDVVTSSNTVSELTLLLKAQGVKTVQVWSVCKALSRWA